MIVVEKLFNLSPIQYRVYSDQNFYIQANEIKYTEAFVSKEEEKNKYVETNYPIPSPIASTQFVYNTFLGEYKNITEDDITSANPIIKKAIYNLNDEDLYQLFNLLPIWRAGTEYTNIDIITYKDSIYKVIQNHISFEEPNNSNNYKLVVRPSSLALEWNERREYYNLGEKVKLGNKIYISLVENNIWSPSIFPTAWQLISGSQD